MLCNGEKATEEPRASINPIQDFINPWKQAVGPAEAAASDADKQMHTQLPANHNTADQI